VLLEPLVDRLWASLKLDWSHLQIVMVAVLSHGRLVDWILASSKIARQYFHFVMAEVELILAMKNLLWCCEQDSLDPRPGERQLLSGWCWT